MTLTATGRLPSRIREPNQQTPLSLTKSTTEALLVHHVSIDHRRPHVFVAQQFLHTRRLVRIDHSDQVPLVLHARPRSPRGASLRTLAFSLGESLQRLPDFPQ